MKRHFLLLAAICLPLTVFAGKQPKRMFSTVDPPYAGGQWKNGDLISLPGGHDSTGVEYFAETGSGRTFFCGRGASRSDEARWLAVFPAASVRAWAGGKVRFVIPHEQIAGKLEAPLYSASQDFSLSFKPLTAYLKITIAPGNPPVKEIRVLANKFISGSYQANLDAAKVSVQLDAGDRFRDIVLKSPDGGAIPPGDYMAAIFARILPNGISVEIESEDGRVVSAKFTRKITLVAGKIKDLGIIDNLSLDDRSCAFIGEKYNMHSGSGEYPRTEVGKTLKGEACPKVLDVLWDTTYNVTNGLDYHQLKVEMESHDTIDLFLLRTDPSKGLELRVAWSNLCTPSKWVRQTPAEMAAHMDSPSKPVYAIVNADFCENKPPIRPRGPMHCDGKILVGSYSMDPRFTQQALSYVGVTFDGKITIGTNPEYAAAQKGLKECTGAGVILIRNSEIQGGYVATDVSQDPRTALGYTPDDIVWILSADGRHKGTEGVTYMDMAEIFRSLGCSDAVNLDGGGSTQMLVREPRTAKIELRNWPSDPTTGFGGRERPRLNGWAVMKR